MTFCGTQEYIAPEILAGAGYNRMVDYWTFGCLIYEMLVGHPPFRSTSRNKRLVFELINRGEYKIPKNLDESAADIIKKLLEVDVCSCYFSQPSAWVLKVLRR